MQLVPMIVSKVQNLPRLLAGFLVLISMFMCLNMNTALASHAGNQFDHSEEKSVMPKGWKQQPVVYKREMADADIVMVLDQQTHPAFAADIMRFAEKNKIKLVLSEGSCGVSAGGLSRKNIDIGAYCCPPGESDRLPGLEFRTLGIAPIALLVNKDNPVSNVSLEEAEEIFKGELYRWSGLKTDNGGNGKNTPIQVIGRLHCKNRPGHWRLLLDNEEDFSPGLREVGTIKDMLSQISKNKRAIGYETLWMVRHYINNKGIKHLNIDSVSPANKKNVLKKKYPLYRTYSLAYWKDKSIRNPLTDKFIAFMERLIEEKGDLFGIIPASQLGKAGWEFRDGELTGEPLSLP